MMSINDTAGDGSVRFQRLLFLAGCLLGLAVTGCPPAGTASADDDRGEEQRAQCFVGISQESGYSRSRVKHAGRRGTTGVQQAGTLTARPPSEVSL